ncbi:MAG TPA: hypothetical protein VF079_08850 [Sphingomicrobium sp.]
MRELLGGCLQAVGILIAGLTGLCTLIMLSSVNSWRSLSYAAGNLLFFAIPFVIGLGLIAAGRALVRRAREDRF